MKTAIIILLLAAVGILGYLVWQESQTESVAITVGEGGVAIEAETPLTVPMRVDVIDELPEPVIEAEVGASHLCARAESGRLWCWGRDNNEQLGPVDPPLGKRAVELDLECPPGIGS